MRVPLLLAHGQGLISYVFVLFGAGIAGFAFLVAAVVTTFIKPGGSYQTALWCSFGFIACALFIMLAPLLIGALRLP